MPSRFSLSVVPIAVAALFVLSLFAGCASQRALEKKQEIPAGKEQTEGKGQTEGQLEAIPAPISPQKKQTSQSETPAGYVEQEVPANVEESDVSSGFRVQIFASASMEKAEEIAAKARSVFSERVYVEYVAPLYRVRVGNFASKDEALEFREKAVQSGYEGAWVVEALIERE